jgi:tetratricopeptide (TPR) repeat protein
VIEQILLADRHLQVDQVAKARDIYERVVELDPGNAIAVVGLARCALADGEDRQAYELAARALSIDPEDEMARRMEARLSEILATRGQQVERPAAAATSVPHDMRHVVTEPAVTDAGPPRSTAMPGATPTSTPTTTKEPPVRKSLLDRMLGR